MVGRWAIWVSAFKVLNWSRMCRNVSLITATKALGCAASKRLFEMNSILSTEWTMALKGAFSKLHAHCGCPCKRRNSARGSSRLGWPRSETGCLVGNLDLAALNAFCCYRSTSHACTWSLSFELYFLPIWWHQFLVSRSFHAIAHISSHPASDFALLVLSLLSNWDVGRFTTSRDRCSTEFVL